MAEVSLAPAPERATLLGQLGARLADLDPSLRVVARDLLAAETSIDFVAVDSAGRTVLVLVGEAGGDLALVARGLAHRAWVAPRLGDWLQLAPNLGIRPEAGVRVVLLSPGYGSDARAAAAAVGSAALELATYRCVRNGGWAGALLEWLGGAPGPAVRPTPTAEVPSPPDRDPDRDRIEATAPAARFRTGLREEDLELSAGERAEFE